MIDLLTLSRILAVFAFAAGVGIVGLLLNDENLRDYRKGFASLMIIPAFALLSYAAMAFDIGIFTINNTPVNIPRYIDWAVTTPILVGFVGYIAGASRKLIAAVIVADILMITTGFLATVSVGSMKWFLFAVSSVFQLSLFGVIYRVFPKFVSVERLGLFKLLQNHIGVLWIGYPLLWLTSTGAFSIISLTGFGLIIAYLDVVAKVPYVYFVWKKRHVFTDKNLDSTEYITTESNEKPIDLD